MRVVHVEMSDGRSGKGRLIVIAPAWHTRPPYPAESRTPVASEQGFPASQQSNRSRGPTHDDVVGVSTSHPPLPS
ncbi:hypothetical protein LZ30DRAFT_703085 [Colletotrichum cereale]|nr:hypothetical protein LZ30DRAFT_703085 [Colletotrichum cereale]